MTGGGVRPVADGLVLVGPSRYADSHPWAEAAARARAAGIARVVCAPAMPPDRDLDAANRRLLDVQQRGADDEPEAVALARVDPRDGDPAACAARALDAGARGVFLHPWEETFQVTDTVLLEPVMAVARAREVPVVVEAGFPWLAEPAQVGRLAARFPDVTLVATRGAHMNMSGLSGEAALRALRRNANLHVTTSGVYRQDWLEAVLDAVGAQRLVFASLSPVLDVRLELTRVEALEVTAETRAALLWGNAARLFTLT